MTREMFIAEIARLICCSRFTSMWEISNPSGTYDPLTAFQPTSLTGISTDLLISINNLKLGGR